MTCRANRRLCILGEWTCKQGVQSSAGAGPARYRRSGLLHRRRRRQRRRVAPPRCACRSSGPTRRCACRGPHGGRCCVVVLTVVLVILVGWTSAKGVVRFVGLGLRRRRCQLQRRTGRHGRHRHRRCRHRLQCFHLDLRNISTDNAASTTKQERTSVRATQLLHAEASDELRKTDRLIVILFHWCRCALDGSSGRGRPALQNKQQQTNGNNNKACEWAAKMEHASAAVESNVLRGLTSEELELELETQRTMRSGSPLPVESADCHPSACWSCPERAVGACKLSEREEGSANAVVGCTVGMERGGRLLDRGTA